MRASRVAARALAALVALVLVATTTAFAQTTITEQLIQELNSRLLAIAIPVTVVVEGILIYTVWKYRTNDEPQPTKENRQLEITWTVATAIILLFVGFAAYGVMANPNVIATQQSVQDAGDESVRVQVTGVQWYWQFAYPGENVSGVQNEMVVPVNRTLVIETRGRDVVHSFFVPAMGLKVDAIPGQTNVLQTRALETGTYTLFCTEYCGAGHSEMLGNVSVVSEERYQAWLDEQRGG